jgi:ribosomal protein S27AE
MDQQGWIKQSEEILSEITEWRQAHPKATFVEIEEEVHRRMMQLEARVLQDAACPSASQHWGGSAGPPAPSCPRCGVALQARGRHTRRLQGNGGQSVKLERTYGTCPRCGESFFPPG